MPDDAGSALSANAFDSLLDHLLTRARALGADAADAVVAESRALEASVRQREVEDVERSEARDLGLRVFVGKKQANVSSSDFSTDGLEALAERAVAMAKASPDEPYAGLAPQERLATEFPDLELFDPQSPEPADLEQQALTVEAAALDVPGVAKSDQAFAGWSTAAFRLATSHGFAAGWASSMRHVGVSVIAEQDGAMERDHESDSARFLEDLKPFEDIGRKAGMRAIRRVGARKIKSGKRTVVFENRVAGAFLNAFQSAISGPAIARGVSFLKDQMGQPVFGDHIDVIDDPLVKRGPGSRPFDGEGVAVERTRLIDQGRLTGWMLNSASARQLGLETTGHAGRGVGGPPGVAPSNLWLAPGAQSLDEMIGDVTDGVFITEMFGPSLNANTGDWSVGVSGFRIEKGALTTPVSEITVAGNLKDIYARLIPASDLEFRGRINAPSLRVDALSVAGS